MSRRKPLKKCILKEMKNGLTKKEATKECKSILSGKKEEK